jgi:hypothetical protein
LAFQLLFPLYKREAQFKIYRFLEWLRLTLIPPIYFRIQRLEEIKEPEKIKNTFWRSIKDNLKALLNA